MCLWTHGCGNIHTMWLQRKPKTQEHWSTAIKLLFSPLTSSQTHIDSHSVQGVTPGWLNESLSSPGSSANHTHVVSVPWRMKSTLSYCYFLDKKRTASLCSRAPGVLRVGAAPRLLASREQGGASWSNPSMHRPGKAPKVLLPLGLQGKRSGSLPKSSKMQMCLHLGTGQDHFCFLQPHLKACTFQVMKSATHFEWKIPFMWIDLFCKWHVKRAFWRHYIFQRF